MYSRKIQGDIIHVTGDIHYIVPFLSRNSKSVLTIHDLVAINRTKWYSPKYWILKYFWYVIPVRFANEITVISEKTKSDLIALTNVKPSKVSLIHNFVKPLFEPDLKVINRKEPVFLLIGGGAHKNTTRSILALKTVSNARIILLGIFPKEVFDLIEINKIPFKHFTNIAHEEVLLLYQQSDIILFPSLYEGFGMPIIEGQSVGRVVITSNISPMCDIAGQNACLVNPESIDSIRKGIEHILEDEQYATKVIQSGFLNVNRFNIKSISSQYEHIYSKLE